jgi:hypothetical protein
LVHVPRIGYMLVFPTLATKDPCYGIDLLSPLNPCRWQFDRVSITDPKVRAIRL